MPALPFCRRLVLFAALSLTDLLLTWYLLSRRGGAYESNPAAAWWLEQFGWPGLAGFKLATLGLVAVLVVAVARRRPRTAGRVLLFACGTLGFVIVYSSSLIPGVYADDAHMEQIEDRSQQLEKRCQRHRVFSAMLHRLANELATKQCSLVDAVDRLAGFEEVRQPSWIRNMLRRFPSYTQREHLAIRLMEEAFWPVNNETEPPAELAADLHAQFQDCFGRSAPLPGPPSQRY